MEDFHKSFCNLPNFFREHAFGARAIFHLCLQISKRKPENYSPSAKPNDVTYDLGEEWQETGKDHLDDVMFPMKCMIDMTLAWKQNMKRSVMVFPGRPGIPSIYIEIIF